MVSYAEMFAGREQRVSPQSGATLVKLNKVLDEPEVEKNMNAKHLKKKRLGHKHDNRELIHTNTLHLSSIFFSAASFINTRNLQSNITDADGFATLNKKPSKRSKKQKIKEEKKKDKNKDKGNIHHKNEGGRKKKRKYQPKISNLSPSRGTKISSSQTFSARVLPSSVTNADIRSVSFRLVDPLGETSDWLPVPQAYDDNMYEITIEGFGAFPASKWKYQMNVKDEEGRSVDSPNVMFRVDGELESDDDLETLEDDWTDEKDAQGFADGVEDEEEELMKLGVVGDSNWPHGGGIQSATGRILFEFNGSGTYVCSGTVVKDDEIKGRSVILVSARECDFVP